MFVKPAPGLQVRIPETRQLLPESGAEVPANSFWLRRIRDKDVVVTPAPEPPPTPEH